MLEVIPEKQNAIELEITPFDSKEKKAVTLMLEGFPSRPERTTKSESGSILLDEKTMKVVLTDRGFGELFPATDTRMYKRLCYEFEIMQIGKGEKSVLCEFSWGCTCILPRNWRM